MSVVEKVVNEWAFRCKKGYPDMNNPDDMKILKEIYSEYGIVLEEEKPKDTASNQDMAYIENVLQVFDVTPADRERALKSPLLRTANTIEDFGKNIAKYEAEFGFLFNYGKRPYGKGELLPFLSIKGAKLGASKEKDITAGGKVLEVKELDNGKYFDTASGGSISGTSFLQNVQMFFRYLEKFDVQGKYEDRINYFNQQFSRGGMSGGELKELIKVAKDLQGSGKAYHYLKLGDKRYAIDPGQKYTVEIDDQGQLITNLPTAEDLKVFQAKLAKHPWVQTNGEKILEDLQEIESNYLKDIDYLLLYRKGTAVFLDKEQAKDSLIPYRIALGNLHLELTGK
jgi:hypothetical protein